MSVVNKEIKFSSKIQTDDSFNVFKKYHDLLITEMFYFQQQWLTAAFRRFKDFDKYIILIYLINKAFKDIIETNFNYVRIKGEISDIKQLQKDKFI